MFSWITGPRITNEIEDLQPENNYESTFIEAPETPAHQFAVKAFKHAIFGTPAPEDANEATKKRERRAKIDAANANPIELPVPNEETPPMMSPSKQPGGVLRTPGTASKGRKTVSFGSQVVDNEGKRGNTGKSGIPNDCPGKFPSPWTPGTQLQLEPGSDKRPRTKLTEALLDARTTTQPRSGQKPKARDDSDITIDLGAPRSESGKYWKDQYESYAERSEKEMKKVIAKQQLAKKFAMKKDTEVTELANKLEQERRKSRQRERELEQQNEDLQERLRKVMAENASTTIEIATLRARVATLEHSAVSASLSSSQSKPSFDIYEDLSKAAEASLAPSVSLASSGKENKSPKARRNHRQSLPEISSHSLNPTRIGAREGEASIILGKAPRSATKPEVSIVGPEREPANAEQPAVSPLKLHAVKPTKANNTTIPPSSPLPVPSPGLDVDPWMDLDNNSSIPQMDKMAMPISTGQPYSRPSWNPPSKQHRPAKSISQTRSSSASQPARREKKSFEVDVKQDETKLQHGTVGNGSRGITRDQERKSNAVGKAPREISKKPDSSSNPSPTDPKFDLSRITTHHAEGSAQVTTDRAQLPPEDRKEKAKRRLEERKKLRKNTPT